MREKHLFRKVRLLKLQNGIRSENVEEAKKVLKKYNGLVVKKIEVWYNMTKCKRMHWYVKKINKTVHGFANTGREIGYAYHLR